MAKLFTVGYEGCDINQFVAGLKENGIEHLADIRKNPVSGKKGFSKKRLAEELAKEGIEYTHWPSLGVPTLWRKEAKAKIITRDKMFKDYVKKVLPEVSEEIAELKKLILKKKLVLLCYEADESDCHRHYLVQEMQKKKKIKVVNLVLKPESPRLFNLTMNKNLSS
ncbi:hypothetical protein AZI86_00545 [Bdellovibrio bacteriovorus]|uniref:DUF488 domain-containing protein n=1 Tax=Bdellovibrio bacteriovorus TaxID=959 RepID=A0A150WMB5_BDEBC|nr:DUF488 domain-containing protein [Bdellovibrio bacteriovorus]KYG65602.1 hypothetical protein AZI86_00545 [Bdellovibrio bacteriovorus]